MLQSTEIHWSNIHENGSLWYQHLKLRKSLFVGEKEWAVPHNEHVEWDQYDTGNTLYVVTHVDGVARAASRINPCNFSSPQGTYMIRDASLGMLPGIDPGILSAKDTPTTSDVWEATRFAVDPKLNAEERTAALTQNAIDLADAAKKRNIRKLVALMPPAYIRWLSNIGLPTSRVGPTKRDANGGKCCVIEMQL